MAIDPEAIIRVSHYINESERDADPANNAGKVVKLEGDGKFSPKFINLDIQTIDNTTLQLTTDGATRILVIAKGNITIDGSGSVSISYDGVVKDSVSFNTSGQNGVVAPFMLMYTDTPPAQTANIVVSGGTNVKIMVLVV